MYLTKHGTPLNTTIQLYTRPYITIKPCTTPYTPIHHYACLNHTLHPWYTFL